MLTSYPVLVLQASYFDYSKKPEVPEGTANSLTCSNGNTNHVAEARLELYLNVELI